MAANSVVSGGILTKFKLIQAFIAVLVTLRMKKIHPKIKALEWSQHSPIICLWGFFKLSGAANSLVHGPSCQISNPSEIVWLFLLPARIKKNQSKMKKIEWSQDFRHYNPIGATCRHGNQSSDPI